ncbi:hypothetical protein KFE25_006688 [Diacronema lutheri]|uniref:Uncharacterized protein n=1 Tax=Diacronema lutheri TaxID=2081491 RepID=A0A8J5XF23_DIALT|nr:hypothetical protein KFE25_006688 [Diacronema lutheri]
MSVAQIELVAVEATGLPAPRLQLAVFALVAAHWANSTTMRRRGGGGRSSRAVEWPRLAHAATSGAATHGASDDGGGRESRGVPAASDAADAPRERERAVLARAAELDACAAYVPQTSGAIERAQKGGNVLHSDEQLALLVGCAGPPRAPRAAADGAAVVDVAPAEGDAVAGGTSADDLGGHAGAQVADRAGGPLDSTSAAVLADLLEAKLVDVAHVAPAVRLILTSPEGTYHHAVRDSALRAMLRLHVTDRDGLHRSLLAGGAPLPLQTLFAFSVTTLDAAAVVPLGAPEHARDPRFFRLFVACTEPRAAPRVALYRVRIDAPNALVAPTSSADGLVELSAHALTGTNGNGREIGAHDASHDASELLGGVLQMLHPSPLPAALEAAQQIAQLRATDDADWPVCRRAVAHAHAAAALSIAVALLKHSRELRDLELLRRAFGAAASFERKRLVLRAELS